MSHQKTALLLALAVCSAFCPVLCHANPVQSDLEALTRTYLRRVRRVMREAGSTAGQQPTAASVSAKLPEVCDALTTSNLLDGRKITVDNVTRPVMVLKNDEWVGASILQGKMFEAHVLREMLQHIMPGSAVVEAGANLGAYTVFFADKVGSTGRVLAFEPQNLVHQVLGTNMLVNGYHHVRAVNGAAYYKNGYVRMMGKVTDSGARGQDYSKAVEKRAKMNFGGMSLGHDGEETLARTIDSYNLENVSFMKFDVQGSEPLAIYGARETIKRCKPVVSYECNTEGEFASQQWLAEYSAKVGGLPDDVLKFDPQAYLKSLGYTLGHKIGAFDTFWYPPGYSKQPLPIVIDE